MTDETKHLLKWQFEWLKRFLRTWYHILNRGAYHTFKNRKYGDAIIGSDNEQFYF